MIDFMEGCDFTVRLFCPSVASQRHYSFNIPAKGSLFLCSDLMASVLVIIMINSAPFTFSI